MSLSCFPERPGRVEYPDESDRDSGNGVGSEPELSAVHCLLWVGTEVLAILGMRLVVLCAVAISFFFPPGLLLPSGASIEVEVEESVSVSVGIPGLELLGLVCFLDLFVAAVVAVSSFSLFAGGTRCSAADSTYFGLRFFFLLLDSSFPLSAPTGGVGVATFSGLSSAKQTVDFLRRLDRFGWR